MRVLAAQLASSGDVAADVQRAGEVLDEHSGVALAAFPELFLGGYDLRGVAERAIRPGGPELAGLAAVAARNVTAVIVGFVEAVVGGVANAVACIDRDGTVAAVYRKTHLFAHEREAFTAGDRLTVVTLAGTPLGPLVCFDVEFPEPARALAQAGAQLLVTVAANMAPYYDDHELASRARAFDNRLPHLYVNRVKQQGGLSFVGGSRVIASDGRVIAQAADDTEEILLADVGLHGPAEEHGDDVAYLTHLRGELPVDICTPAGTGGEKT